MYKHVDELEKGDIIIVEYGDYDNWVEAEVLESKLSNEKNYNYELRVRNLNCDYSYLAYSFGRNRVKLRSEEK